MQQLMFTIPFPPLLILGFLIGIILIVLGYREQTDFTRHQHLMGLGIIIIGIMIPVSVIAWYGYLVLANRLVLGIIEISIIAAAFLIAISIIFIGFMTYSKSQ
ncbi:MAG: hypothetical protein ACFFAZ_07240 [Promethearchaeota archaeon]